MWETKKGNEKISAFSNRKKIHCFYPGMWPHDVELLFL